MEAKKKRKYIIIGGVVILAVGIGVGIYLWRRRQKQLMSSTTTTDTTTTTTSNVSVTTGNTGSMGGSVGSGSGGSGSGSPPPRVNITVWPLRYISPPAPVDPRVKTVQSAINKYASAKGISKSYLPLDVDGKFGSKTQQAVQELSKSILGVSTSTISESQYNSIKKYA